MCCSQIARVLNRKSCEKTCSLDSTNSVHNAGCATERYQVVRPGKVSPGRFVPIHIKRPPYALVSKLSRVVHNSWLSSQFGIEVKSEEQITGMRNACRYAFAVLCSVWTSHFWYIFVALLQLHSVICEVIYWPRNRVSGQVYG